MIEFIDIMLHRFVELDLYTQGVFIGMHLTALWVVLWALYCCACLYWEYVEESDDFRALDTNGFFLPTRIAKYKHAEHASGWWFAPVGLILSLIWPVTILWCCTAGVAKLHRGIRRIQKKVDKLERKS